MLYRWVRDLHLYLGLFVSPFVLVFAASVLYLNHAKLVAGAIPEEHYSNLRVPDGFDRLKGRAAVELAREILPQVGMSGEIGFVRYVAPTRHLIFPVSRAGHEATVDVALDGRFATVTRRRTDLWEALAFLHKMPGPHNVAIRGNWIGIRMWRWFADATVCLLLFITITGIYLWWAIKADRAAGLTLAAAGAATFGLLIYVIVR